MVQCRLLLIRIRDANGEVVESIFLSETRPPRVRLFVKRCEVWCAVHDLSNRCMHNYKKSFWLRSYCYALQHSAIYAAQWIRDAAQRTVMGRCGTFTACLDATSTAQIRFPEPGNN